MDKVEIQLRNVARHLADGLRSRFQQTAAEIADLEEQLHKLKAEIRLAAYRAQAVPGVYRCPNCWLSEGKAVPLKPVRFQRPREDVLRCFSCGRDFGISVRG